MTCTIILILTNIKIFIVEIRARRSNQRENLLFTNFQVLKRMSCQAERSRSLIIQALLLNAGARILLVLYMVNYQYNYYYKNLNSIQSNKIYKQKTGLCRFCYFLLSVFPSTLMFPSIGAVIFRFRISAIAGQIFTFTNGLICWCCLNAGPHAKYVAFISGTLYGL